MERTEQKFTEVRKTDIEGFIEALSSSSPVPGGGATACLAGSLGAALGLMVSNLTAGKKKYAEFEVRLSEIMPKLESAKDEFLRLADEDEKNFIPLSLAYKLPHDTEEERRVKEREMEKALCLACRSPLRALELSVETTELLSELFERGSRLAISDTGVGARLLETALSSSILNIFINTKMMKDREYAEKLNSRASELFEEGRKKSGELFERALDTLKGGGIS